MTDIKELQETPTSLMLCWEDFFGNENGKKSKAKTCESHRGRWF